MRRSTYRVPHLAVLGSALLACAAPAAAQSSFVLRGTIRDFKSDHPDFGPSIATGHFPGNVALGLGASGKPVFSDGGFEAVSQWRDRWAHPIAPHMYMEGRVAVSVVNLPQILNKSYADSYDSATGSYDPLDPGPAPDWIAGSPMPKFKIPSLDVTKVTSFVRNKNKATSTLSDDVWCDDFHVGNNHTLQIYGNVTVVVDNYFSMINHGVIQIMPDSSLTVYTRVRAEIHDQCHINDGGDRENVRFFHAGTLPFIIENQCEVTATILSPDAAIHLTDGTVLTGKVEAYTMLLSNQSAFHVDDVPSLCGITVDDTGGSWGDAGGGITDAGTFSHWFEDMIGVNASRAHSIVLRDTTGEYEFGDDGFLPIDDKLYGNQGDPHNYYFTYEIPATFTYDGCTGQSIWFEGDDDCWIFIDGRLVLDLGGVNAGTGQYVELDRLRLVDGQTYEFRLFYAHRHAGPARFNIRTNFQLEPVPVESGVAMYPAHD